MAARTRPVRRAPEDRMLTLYEAAERTSYAPGSLRRFMFNPDPPPMFKVRNRWRVWMSDLDAWIEKRDQPDRAV